MGLFKRKKKKKENMDEFLQGITLETDGKRGEKGAQHQAMEYCEQIMNAARELEEAKKEYRIVTDYLRDVQIIEDLPEEKRTKLQETAQNVFNLSQTRDAYVNKDRGISDAQFNQMEQLEEEMTDNILRLSANEKYQSVVKRDMDYLEGEKGSLIYQIESIAKEQKLLKIALYVILALFVAAVIFITVLQAVYHMDMMLPYLLAAFVAAVVGGGAFIRMQNNQRRTRQAKANINRAITLLNQMKAKYVNVTNAVDYACEKFHVRNSMELNYVWERYLEEAKEREAYAKTNDDLDYFSGRLVRELKAFKLYDAAVWVRQTNAILDKKEMVELKHYLLVRRQKLRTRLEHQVNTIQSAKKQIQVLLKEQSEYKREILDVLKSIDKMCAAK